MTLDVMADTIGLMKEKNIYNKLKNIVNTFEAKLEVKLTSHMTYVYKDIDGLKTLRIWVGKYIKHILNKGAKIYQKACKNGAKRSEILCIIG